MVGLMGHAYTTPLVLLSEDLVAVGGLRTPGADASGGLVLLFGHGVLATWDVKQAARKAILSWAASQDIDPTTVTWNDAAHDMPGWVWEAYGLNLLGLWSIEEAALLNEAVSETPALNEQGEPA